jgi:Na+-translocating ferredoxin:NAD+ oxidoreductase subunit E
MNEDLKKSLFFKSSMPILGLGIIAPLYAGAPLHTNALLGILAVIVLILSNVTLAALRAGTPKNARIGIALLITAGLLTIANIALSAFPLAAPLPIETLSPLMLIAAVLASVTDAYDGKKKLSLALFDGAEIGFSFMLLLCLSGVVRDLLGTNTFNKLPVMYGFQPLRILVLVPGVLLVAALIVFFLPNKKRGAL